MVLPWTVYQKGSFKPHLDVLFLSMVFLKEPCSEQWPHLLQEQISFLLQGLTQVTQKHLREHLLRERE